MRGLGVAAGGAGLVVFVYSAWLLVSWLRGPMDDGDRLIIALTFGIALAAAYMGILLSVVLAAMSGFVVKDALGPCTARVSGRLLVLFAVATVCGVFSAFDAAFNRVDVIVLLLVATITALHLAFILAVLRARRLATPVAAGDSRPPPSDALEQP